MIRPRSPCGPRKDNKPKMAVLPASAAAAAAAASEQQSSNGPVKKSMREKAVERRNINKEHNSNFKAGYIPIDEGRLHKTGLRGRKGNLAICVLVLLFILAVVNLIITFIIWTVIRIGPNGCDSMEFHDSGLLRFKQDSDMGIIHPLYKSTVGGRRNEDLVIVGENQPIVFQQGETKLSVEKNKTSITSDIGMEFVDPRTQNTLFSTDYNTHEFHLPSGVKILNVQKASTERITSNATSDLNIKVDGRAIVRGNEGVFITGKTIKFSMGRNLELKADNSIILNGSMMINVSRLPNSSHKEQFNNGDWERYKLCVCSDGTLFRIPVKSHNMGCQTATNPCGNTY
ncbi:beta-sarcoglycan [Protobothrops mucrosquamatus]|uniref:beta-sarcoglycan n=2 Tax=Protobothrops mucrosquamatus TaxID=103944 RepID=UPI0010FB3D63|nr:beta-sarcoglycan [Protobothrops mucrosquamatus]